MTMQQWTLPFSFNTNADGTIHQTTNPERVVFPEIKNRRIWCENHPEIAFTHEAVAFAVRSLVEKYGCAVTWREVQKELIELGFGKFKETSISGNFTHAHKKLGLIKPLKVINHKTSRQGKTSRNQLWATPEFADKINSLTESIADWIDTPNNVTEMDLLNFLENFVKTARSNGDGLKSLQSESFIADHYKKESPFS
jgi:hypothetical protein